MGRLVAAAQVNAVTGMGYVSLAHPSRQQLLRPLLRVLMRAALGGDRASLILQNRDDVEKSALRWDQPCATVRT